MTARRHAMTLMEVLVALAILLIGIGATTALISAASTRSVAVEQKGQAARLCQSKMAEVACGAVPLSSQGDTPFDEDGEYTWSLDAEQGTVANLWTVTVTVKHTGPNGVKCSTSQMVLDPSMRGSIYDTVAISSSSSSSQGGSTPGGSSQQPAQQGGSSPPAGNAPPGGSGGVGGMPKGGGNTGTPKGGTTPVPAGGTPKGGTTPSPASGTPKGGATTAPAIGTPTAPATGAPKGGAGTTTGGR